MRILIYAWDKRENKAQRATEGGERGGGAGWGYDQDQSTSAEWALEPSCDLWPASAPKTQILLTIASCSTCFQISATAPTSNWEHR